MNLFNAQMLLAASITNLTKLRGTITDEEIQTETINVTCKYLLERYKGELKQVHDTNEISKVISYNHAIVYNDVLLFVKSARNLYPNQTLSTHTYTGQSWSESTLILIIPNICWAGMWGFLRTYFLQNHKIAIDKIEISTTIFNSGRHVRYQQGIKVGESLEIRIVQLVFNEQLSEVEVSISPSLSPKTAKLISKSGAGHLYLGDDPDYQFLIIYDEFEDVEKFELFMPNRSLKIVYHDN